MGSVDPARVRLGRIRCLVNTVNAMRKGDPLPAPLCFVPKEFLFELEAEEAMPVFEEAKEDAKVVGRLQQKKTHKLVCAGLPTFNAAGGWMQITSPLAGWVLLQPSKKAFKGKLKAVKKTEDGSGAGNDKEGKSMLTNWLKAVELMCSLQIVKAPSLSNHDEETMAMLQAPPPGWNMAADEELAQYLVENCNTELTGRGGMEGKGGENFTKIEVSSEESEVDNLLDPDPENYWESDGSQGQHWLRFHLKPGIIIERFSIIIDPDDGSYLPRRVVVKAGPAGNLSTIHTHNYGLSDFAKKELQLFPLPLQEYKEIVEVHVKTCYQGGIDVRVRGLSLTTKTAETLFLASEMLSEDSFTEEKVSRYPKLQGFKLKQLFLRGLILNRLALLLDQDFTYLLPSWNRGTSTSSKILDAASAIRQLWPLSRRRSVIMQDMLSITATSSPSRPTVYIDRMAAKRHLEDPSQDKEGKKTVFSQLQHELKKHTNASTYNYRWAGQWSQWWECKFVQEGIIDQGGGFRDTLADIADELCPSKPDAPIALPLFIRSPNQSQDSSNAYRDNYIPNPSCDDVAQFMFIGQLMGAMFRSQENLVLSLSQFLLKQLANEPVTWSRDFVSIDSAEVRLIESIETMSKEKFNDAFAGALNYTTVLSNGETVSLVEDGADKLVTYEDRFEYCRLVKEKRMTESDAQVKALRSGFCKVVPPDLLGLLTWQELEVKVCGSPEISIEKLKSSARYDGGLSATTARVKMMWEALEKFSNEERSRFLRFITGRRRLPCTIYIDSADGSSKLPTSATCSNTLYLPKYNNVDEAVDRLRYAAYNCVAIDTDMTPWE